MKTKTLALRLEELLDEYDISPEKLAPIAGVSSVSIRSILKGGNPYRSSIEKIAQALGTSFEWLNNGQGERFPKGKIQLSINSTAEGPWKDEAWEMAKIQINKKDETIDRLSIAFDRLTEILSRANVNFLELVKETA